MFRASSNHTIDKKGRVIIPSRFRAPILDGGGNGVFLVQMQGCLYAYTYNEWKITEKKLKSNKNVALSRIKKMIISSAHEATCDRQHRILIPPMLRAANDLSQKIVLIGMVDRFEIWSEEKWAKEYKEAQNDFNNEVVATELASLGF